MTCGFNRFRHDSLKEILERRGDEAIRARYIKDLDFDWSISRVEFDHIILLWHIATNVLCNKQKIQKEEINEDLKRSKLLSDYMFYLLLTLTKMMPHGISDLRIRDTCNEVVQVLEEAEKNGVKFEEDWQAISTSVSGKNGDDGNKSLLRDGIRLANQLSEVTLDPGHGNERWEMLNEVWIEMLTYTASHCQWKQHAKELGRGVELLTHVCLLMANFGFTPQIKFSRFSGYLPTQLPDPTQNLQYYLIRCLD